MQGIRLLLFLFFSLIFVQCMGDAVKVKVAPYELIHDNGSKVWLLKSQKINGEVNTSLNREDKWTIIFYKDYSFVQSRLKDFGRYSAYQGKFIVTSNADKLVFSWYNGEVNEYELLLVNHNKLLFSANHNNQLVEYEYTPMDKRVLELNEKTNEQEEVSIYY